MIGNAVANEEPGRNGWSAIGAPTYASNPEYSEARTIAPNTALIESLMITTEGMVSEAPRVESDGQDHAIGMGMGGIDFVVENVCAIRKKPQ